jgi:ferredoxin
MTSTRIEVSEEYCGGTGYCARISPEVFRLDSARRKAVLLQEVVGDPALLEKVERAETTCPKRAILLHEVEPGTP